MEGLGDERVARSLGKGLVALALCTGPVGCAGANALVVAPGSEVPISMSGGVPDEEGDVLLTGRELEVVGAYAERRTRWTFLYGAVGGRKPIDISEGVNTAAERAGGEAVTGLSVRAKHCAQNLVWPLMWLPIWPGCVIVETEGTVVRRRPEEQR